MQGLEQKRKDLSDADIFQVKAIQKEIYGQVTKFKADYINYMQKPVIKTRYEIILKRKSFILALLERAQKWEVIYFSIANHFLFHEPQYFHGHTM